MDSRERLAVCKRSNYPLVLLVCRLVLAVSQLVVALYTCGSFRGLSRLEPGGSYDLSLETVTKANVDWVPTIGRDAPATGAAALSGAKDLTTPANGLNKYFNLFMIRLLHYFHGKTANFVLYSSILVFSLMVLLSVHDVIRWQKSGLDKPLSRASMTLKSVVYFAASVVVILEFVLVMFYSENMCHMEMLYPFLFWDKSMANGRSELLKLGACKMEKRLVLSLILTSVSLVPDTFLLTLGILPTFRTFAIIHGLKFFSSMIILGFILAILDLKGYMGIAQGSNALGGAEHEATPVERYSEMITSRVMHSVHGQQDGAMKEMSKSVGFDRVMAMFRPEDAEAQQRLLGSTFAKNVHLQTLQTTKSYIYSGVYVWILCFTDAAAGLLLLVKRQRFFVPVLGFVNFVSCLAQLFHIVMVQFPVYNARFFCNIKEYTPTAQDLAFETAAVCSWICNTLTLFKTHRGIVTFLAFLSFSSIINLGLIYK